ncbi:thioredoxin family protein [uncultured Photobacterium sp.]|uniref:thioredoxin family protein n=1 Tax=uncultured Photobacterium sp. TaxID=173973 RepID=UPI0026021A0C|nr:thioredoxin family protein [uncultured Photobacterium sp.]
MPQIKTIILLLLLISSQAIAKSKDIYDPTQNVFENYYEALKTATTTHKNIFVIAGGNWCRWCYKFEKDLKELKLDKVIEKDFVFIKANWSDENKNEDFFNLFPEITAFPHIMIISKDGELLESRNVSFSEEEFREILRKYSITA